MACNKAKDVSTDKFLTAIMPVVVVPDGVLWKVVYEDNGNISTDPELVKDCEFFVDRMIEVGGKKGSPYFHRFTFSHVHFFTLTGFVSFLDKMAVNEHAWKQLFTKNAGEI